MNYIKEYFRQIEAGEVVVSKRVRKQYKKLIHDIDNPGKYVFDEVKANRPIEFIETYTRYSKGNGLESLFPLNYFKRLIFPLYLALWTLG